MPNLDAKTHVATVKCADCGKDGCRVMLNKNGMAYYFCPWTHSDGERCNHKQQWGRKSSQALQKAYIENSRQPLTGTPANDNHTPAKPVDKDPKPAGGGDGGRDVPAKPDSGDIFEAFG